MTLRQFSNGVRVLWNIERDEFLACINDADRRFVGDEILADAFMTDPIRTFIRLPDQDQERVFKIIERKNKEARL